MTNVLFPTTGAIFTFDPQYKVEVAKGVFNTNGGAQGSAPTSGWVLQTGPQQEWAVTLTTADSQSYSVWLRIAGDQTSAQMIFNEDVSHSGERMLRQDGTSILRQNGDPLRVEVNTFGTIRAPG